MMYSFQPLAAIPVDHTGFGIIVTFVLIALVMSVIVEGWAYALVLSVPGALVCLLAYCVSYVWTNQDPKVFPNVQVTGELVQYVAEGYNETVRSGKTTKQVDVHNTYVVYKVEGRTVMLQSKVGTSYPESVILYKN
jgi:uncharacterized membrane protein